MLHYSKVACILTNRQQKQQRTIAKDIVQFRQQYQQRSSQSEYDLNDPERCKNTNPEDTQMIIPGLVGEDPNSKSRLQRQREQLRDWLIQQQMEHASQKQRQKTEGRYCVNSQIPTNFIRSNKTDHLCFVFQSRTMTSSWWTWTTKLCTFRALRWRRGKRLSLQLKTSIWLWQVI